MSKYKAGFVIHAFEKARYYVRFTPCTNIRACVDNDASLAIKAAFPHIEMYTFYAGVHDSEEWQADKWTISFTNTKNGFSFSTDYKTGTEHRRPTKRTAFRSRSETPQADFDSQILNAPNAADVLYCLLSDADADNFTFTEWCDAFGYSDDSIKASGMYHACQDTARSLNKLMTSDERVKLSEILQDY